MKQQTTFLFILIFVFAAAVLVLGLGLAEKGLHEVSGYSEPAGALRLYRDAEGLWVVRFAGEDWSLPIFQTTSQRR